jgi:hypothetical protein
MDMTKLIGAFCDSANGWKDGHDEANRRFLLLCERMDMTRLIGAFCDSANGWKDGHDEANRRFLRLCERS